jgi:hypothetical protein
MLVHTSRATLRSTSASRKEHLQDIKVKKRASDQSMRIRRAALIRVRE